MMNLLRSLISLELQEVNEALVNSDAKDEFVADPCERQFQSAKQLIRPKISPQSSDKPKLFAYSSISLAKNKHRQHENQIDLTSSHEQFQQPEKEELHIHVEDKSNEITKYQLKISLPVNFDLKALEQDDEDSDGETPSLPISMSSNISNEIMYSLSDINETDIPSIQTSCSDSIQSRNDLQIGIFSTNDFKFMYNIGHGAFGIVQKEFHMPSCKIVAIKQCRSNNPEMIETFKNEIKICEEFIDCKYIINMIDYGLIEYENKVCIALEYMNMSSLNKNKFIFGFNTVNRIKHVCYCILNALKCLHANLYVHNDIKPANILFNDHCSIKLTDFGCIRQMRDINIPLTKSIGTEYYQSYEKRFISPVKYTTKSDIYSFGITICELLLHDYCLLKNILKPFEIPNQIIETYSETNSDLIDFLNKSLDRNYESRWSAEQLLNHSFLKGLNDHICIDKIEDMDDLEFMTSTLIDYYASYDNNNEINPLNTAPITPIDNLWSDEKRIQNMAESTGFTKEFVKDFVTKKVSNVKNKLLKF